MHDIEIPAGTKAAEVTCIGCSIRIAGAVQGDATTIGGDIEVTGALNGNATAVGAGVRVGSAGSVGGRVKGEPEAMPYFRLPGQRGFAIQGVLAFLGANAAAILAGALLLRRRADNAGNALVRHPLVAFAIGIALTVLWVALLSAHVPKAWWAQAAKAIAHALLLAALWCGYAGAGVAAGYVFRPGRRLQASLAGGLAAALAMMIPVAGAFIFAALFAAALGACAASGGGHDADWLPRLLKRGE